MGSKGPKDVIEALSGILNGALMKCELVAEKKKSFSLSFFSLLFDSPKCSDLQCFSSLEQSAQVCFHRGDLALVHECD